MRKRFVTTLLICSFAFACAFGFAACGDNNETKPSGSDSGLTGEELKNAINATLKANNAKLNFKVSAEEDEKYALNTTAFYDYDKGTLKIESDDRLELYVTVGESIWSCGKRDNESWNVYKSELDSIREYLEQDTVMTCCSFKVKGDTATEYVAFEDTSSSFKYSSETKSYTATLLCVEAHDMDSDNAEIIEANVSLTVENGYVSKIVLEYIQGEDEKYVYTYTYSDFGTVEIEIPNEVLSEIQANK